MTVHRFTLLRLPENAAVHVLKHMEVFEMLEISLLSRKTQQLASVIRLNAPLACLQIGEHVEVRIHFFSYTYKFVFYEEPSDNLDVTMTPPRNVRMEIVMDPRRNQRIYSKIGWTMKNWADHLFKIFNNQNITAMIMDENGKYDPKSIHAVFPEPQMLCISSSIPQFLSYTDCFNSVPSMRILRPEQENTVTSELQIRKILAQNVKTLTIGVTLTLNDLLISNCDVMYAESNLTEKSVNLFLKLWMKGSFPNLKHLFLQILGGNHVEILMKGIKYEVNEPDRLKKCSKCGDIGSSFGVRGGMDIQRGDGTKATVYMEGGSFQMFVCF